MIPQPLKNPPSALATHHICCPMVTFLDSMKPGEIACNVFSFMYLIQLSTLVYSLHWFDSKIALWKPAISIYNQTHPKRSTVWFDTSLTLFFLYKSVQHFVWPLNWDFSKPSTYRVIPFRVELFSKPFDYVSENKTREKEWKKKG